jgi:hypothetical protein
MSLEITSPPVEERSVRDAIALGPALLERVEREGRPSVAVSIAKGPAIVLGALQRAGRVVDREAAVGAGAALLRRTTTGTAAFVAERALWITIALPHVAALVPDATLRTLLNRNVRGVLRGLTAFGARAHYFGRDWLSLDRIAAMVLGYDATESGSILIECIGGWEHSMALPLEWTTAEERAVDRWVGKPPVALAEALPGRDPAEIAERVLDAIAAHAGATRVLASPPSLAIRPDVESPDDPLPKGYEWLAPARVPVGWIDRASDGASIWLGGDVLTSIHALRAFVRAAGGAQAEERLRRAPMDGARVEDFVEAVKG